MTFEASIGTSALLIDTSTVTKEKILDLTSCVIITVVFLFLLLDLRSAHRFPIQSSSLTVLLPISQSEKRFVFASFSLPQGP